MKTVVDLRPATPIESQITQFIDHACPETRGYTRTVTRGGVLHAASVQWRAMPKLFDECIVCFVDIVVTPSKLEFTLTFTGWVAELEESDGRYYTWSGSYLKNMDTFADAVAAVKKAIAERQS